MPKLPNKQLNYKGAMIGLQDDGLVSLTDMWKASDKPANKTPRDWIRLSQTQELLQHLATQVGTVPTWVERKMGKRPEAQRLIAQVPEVLIVITGGNKAGTYAIPELAIDYAQILSPEFHQWALTVLKERIEEEADPELGIKRSRQRAIRSWQKQGKSSEYITARLESVPKEDYYESVLSQHGVQSRQDYGFCKYQVYKPIIGDTKQFRASRGLKKKQNCKDGMNIEELATTDFAKVLSAKRICSLNPSDAKRCASISYAAAKQVANLLNEC
ncbi:KilA-N domain-containing protein [Phormidium sp. LEGE 05292]|uniref:KilA-N domain-containing protein n=1 Tax=[Phormidium] sp. LEGE 05292 TaxID=767427 RepID=UPI0018814F37|nr:KilA-N domain-containing protein [Phormidium sp. LEGE 05292]MBE9224007.1 KilA-N domain-containing protein [Phormidium sp. LEGE 05292]